MAGGYGRVHRVQPAQRRGERVGPVESVAVALLIAFPLLNLITAGRSTGVSPCGYRCW